MPKLICALLLIAASGLSAQDRPAIGCFSELKLPGYEGLVWQAAITGTAIVKITLNREGRPAAVNVESPHSLLSDWLRRRFNQSSYLPVCAGQTLTLTLKYRLEGEPREAPDNRVIMSGGDAFEFIAHGPVPHITVD